MLLLLLLLHCLLPLTDLEEKLEVGKGELVTSLDTSSGEQQCRGGNMLVVYICTVCNFDFSSCIIQYICICANTYIS